METSSELWKLTKGLNLDKNSRFYCILSQSALFPSSSIALQPCNQWREHTGFRAFQPASSPEHHHCVTCVGSLANPYWQGIVI